MESVLSRLKALEERLSSLEARLVVLESYHQITDRRMSGPKIIVQGDALQRDCGRPPDIVCGNAANPYEDHLHNGNGRDTIPLWRWSSYSCRAMRVTCAVSTKDTKEIEN